MRKIWLILMLSSAALAAPTATFRDTSRRYISGHDIFRVLLQRFPNIGLDQSTDCERFDPKNRLVLGTAHPSSGEAAYNTVSPAFVQWFAKCVRSLARRDINKELETRGNLQRYWGPEATAWIGKQPYAGALADPKSVAWKTIPVEARTMVARHLVRTFIGPGIVLDEDGLARKLAAVPLPDRASALDGIFRLVLNVTLQEEFLAY